MANELADKFSLKALDKAPDICSRNGLGAMQLFQAVTFNKPETAEVKNAPSLAFGN